MHRIFLINFGYFLEREFADLNEAIAFATNRGYEFNIYRNGLLVGSATGPSLSYRSY